MGIQDLPQEGTWVVDNDDICPDAVYMAFHEPDSEGVATYGFYMPPETAIQFGQAVIDKAKELL